MHPRSPTRLAAAAWLLSVAGCAAAAQTSPEAVGATGGTVGYEAWVASEAVDEIARIRFDGRTAAVVSRHPVGVSPIELDGPHGVAISPAGDFVYVTLGHGLPMGSLWKMDATLGRVAGRTPLGRFPATFTLTPDGAYAFISNFNLHGDHVPSSISMVRVADMMEVARTETCVMPHGSRVDPEGTRHYSVCMMDEVLVELDARTGGLRTLFSVRPGAEGIIEHIEGHASEQACSPTWAEPSTDGESVFVTCNRGREVLEIDVRGWRVTRRFATGENPYNLAVTPDGRWLLVSLRNRTDPALEIFALNDGEMAGRVPTSTTLAHGVAVTDDSRYAFVTVEGVGSEPGKVDIVDLAAFVRVASVEVGQQATGIAIVPAAP